jgi:hypothetical protein
VDAIDGQPPGTSPATASSVTTGRPSVAWWRIPLVAFPVALAVIAAFSIVIPPRTLELWAMMLLVALLAGSLLGGRVAGARDAIDWIVTTVIAGVAMLVFGFALFAALVYLRSPVP